MRKTVFSLFGCGLLATPALADTNGPGILPDLLGLVEWFNAERAGMILAFVGLTLVGRGLRSLSRPKGDPREGAPVKVIVLHVGNLAELRAGGALRLDAETLRTLARG